tara:strand:+ start:371 stop:628 length:258 start_codon:yes stop_codon:yes gene_type:complete
MKPKPNIGDFLVCRDPINDKDVFRCIVIGETHQSYDSIVLIHDEEHGYSPGDKFDMMKLDWIDLFRAPFDDTRTHWLVERVEDGT